MVTATLRLIRTSSEPANPPAANRYSTRIDECLAQCQFSGYDEGRSGPFLVTCSIVILLV